MIKGFTSPLFVAEATLDGPGGAPSTLAPTASTLISDFSEVYCVRTWDRTEPATSGCGSVAFFLAKSPINLCEGRASESVSANGGMRVIPVCFADFASDSDSVQLHRASRHA